MANSPQAQQAHGVMRGTGLHTPPRFTQSYPRTLALRWIGEQVTAWVADRDRLIHYETAREIADIWGKDIPALTEFATRGVVTAGLLNAVKTLAESTDVNELRALLAYVEAVPDLNTITKLQNLVNRVVRLAAGDSNDDEIEGLQVALDAALSRWPEIDLEWGAE